LTTNVTQLSSEVRGLEGTVETVKGSVSDLNTTVGGLGGAVGKLETTTEGLATKVAGQCTSLGEVIAHTNKLNSGVSELTGALNLVLGGFLPKLPETTKPVSC
jgi:hypothetical protein